MKKELFKDFMKKHNWMSTTKECIKDNEKFVESQFEVITKAKTARGLLKAYLKACDDTTLTEGYDYDEEEETLKEFEERVVKILIRDGWWKMCKNGFVVITLF